MTDVLIAVGGAAEDRRAAERCTVTVRAYHQASDAAGAVTPVAELHARLAEQAAAHVASGAATSWEAVGVMTGTGKEWVAQLDTGYFRYYSFAQSTVRVTFRDFTAQSTWAAHVARLEGANLEGFDWVLTEPTRREMETAVRARAMADAHDRARAYAEAAGLGTPRLARLFEPGLRPSGERMGMEMAPFAAMRAKSMAADAGMDFELAPPELTVAAEVSADFLAPAG